MADYGMLDRVLHRMALQVGLIAEVSFDLDQRLSGASAEDSSQGHHVFVSGLARAGTTILMRRIYASGAFRSLTYRNMPFVLAPGLWRPAKPQTRHDLRQRAHGDRIAVDADSPESFDEVFWRVFDAGSYLASDHLRPHDPTPEIMSTYARYVSAILKSDRMGRARYLSKNNNNILRLGALARQFPNATILVPFREPKSQAMSLLRQHANFCERQQRDRFECDYATWLGHHEFGLAHRPFGFDRDGRERLAAFAPTDLSYWLESWCQTYEWLERTAPPTAHFVCYEGLCRNPVVWNRIVETCEIAETGETSEPFEMIVPRAEPEADRDVSARSQALYQRLVARTGIVA